MLITFQHSSRRHAYPALLPRWPSLHPYAFQDTFGVDDATVTHYAIAEGISMYWPGELTAFNNCHRSPIKASYPTSD
jgi:hypothetical protein